MIERTTISKYERGTLNPTPENLEELEKALKVPKGTLKQKITIAVPDTSALLRNKRLLNLLLKDYIKIIIVDVVIDELSGFKNKKTRRHQSGLVKKQKKMASQIMSMIDEYIHKHEGIVVKMNTDYFKEKKNPGASKKDRCLLKLAEKVQKQSSGYVDVIHFDKDMQLLGDGCVKTVYLKDYMAKRFDIEDNYQDIIDLDAEFDDLDRFDVSAKKMNLDVLLTDGMTPLISCIRCNDPEKVEERGGYFIPEAKIRKKLLFLLEHGADPDKPDCNMYCHTPLEHCLERHVENNGQKNSSYELFCLLLKHNADHNKCSVDETQPEDKRISELNEGNTPLMIACFQGKMKYVKKLCEMPDLNINGQDCNGYTALIKCAVARWKRRNKGQKCDVFEKIYHFLKDEMKADTRIRDRNNRTAQDWWDRPLEKQV